MNSPAAGRRDKGPGRGGTGARGGGIRWRSIAPGGQSEFGDNPCPLRNPYDALVRATVQDPKPVGTKIFFIRFRTMTYSDLGGGRNPFFRQVSCNTAGNRGTRINRESLKCEVRCLKQEAVDCAKRTQFPVGRDIPAFHYSIIPAPSLLCETKPICLGSAARSSGGTTRTNKPNLPRSNRRRVGGKAAGAAATGGKRAKQSQFVPERNEG